MSNDKELASDLWNDGVQGSIEEGWVDPADFEDSRLDEVLTDAVLAYEDFKDACHEAERALQNYLDLN